MEANVHRLHKMADVQGQLYAEKLYSCFDDPSEINKQVSVEDFAAGFEAGARYASEGLQAIRVKVAELISISVGFDEKCSEKIAYELEELCKKL